MAMLHLAERCAEILTSVRSEIDAAGVDVALTLKDPLQKLVFTYQDVLILVQKYVAHYHFIETFRGR